MLRRILAEIAKSVAPAALAYGALMALTLALDPPARGGVVDSAEATRTLFAVEPAYVVFRSTRLDGDGTAVVLIGASNIETGFRPEQLAPLLPGARVHNLGVGGTNVDGLRTLVELAYAGRSPEQRRKLVFVAGLWYGMFLHMESNPEQTPVALQLKRFGLFRATGGGGYERRLPREGFDLAVAALQPFFLVQSVLKADGAVAGLIKGTAKAETGWSQPEAGDARDFPLPDAQFQALDALARRVAEMGGTLVLVDLPQRHSFTQASPLWHRYNRAKGATLERARANGAVVVDMQDMDADDDFADATHPRPTTAPRWSARLAAELAAHGIK